MLDLLFILVNTGYLFFISNDINITFDGKINTTKNKNNDNECNKIQNNTKTELSSGSFGQVFIYCDYNEELANEEDRFRNQSLLKCNKVIKKIFFNYNRNKADRELYNAEFIISKIAGLHDIGPRTYGDKPLICQGNVGTIIMDKYDNSLEAENIDITFDDIIAILKKVNKMHEIGIFHRDLFLRNIMMKTELNKHELNEHELNENESFENKAIKKTKTFCIIDYGISLNFSKPVIDELRAYDYASFLFYNNKYIKLSELTPEKKSKIDELQNEIILLTKKINEIYKIIDIDMFNNRQQFNQIAQFNIDQLNTDKFQKLSPELTKLHNKHTNNNQLINEYNKQINEYHKQIAELSLRNISSEYMNMIRILFRGNKSIEELSDTEIDKLLLNGIKNKIIAENANMFNYNYAIFDLLYAYKNCDNYIKIAENLPDNYLQIHGLSYDTFYKHYFKMHSYLCTNASDKIKEKLLNNDEIAETDDPNFLRAKQILEKKYLKR
jgi:hypothetical protein